MSKNMGVAAAGVAGLPCLPRRFLGGPPPRRSFPGNHPGSAPVEFPIQRHNAEPGIARGGVRSRSGRNTATSSETSFS